MRRLVALTLALPLCLAFARAADDDTPAAAKKTTADEELVNVTYQELFDDSPVTPQKRTVTPTLIERPTPKVSDNRDKKKSKSGDFPDMTANPYR